MKVTAAWALRSRASVAVAARVCSPSVETVVPETNGWPSRVATTVASGSEQRISGATGEVSTAPAGSGRPPARIASVGGVERTVNERAKVAWLPAASARTTLTEFAPSRQATGVSVNVAPLTVAGAPPTVAVASSESALPVKAVGPSPRRAPSAGSVVTSCGALRSRRK